MATMSARPQETKSDRRIVGSKEKQRLTNSLKMRWRRMGWQKKPLTGRDRMPRRKSLGEVIFCLTFAWAAHLAPQIALGQAAPSQSQPSPQLIPRTHAEREMRFQMEHRIILNVQVSDASGEPMRHLQKKDFTLLQDQQPQPLTSFREVGPNTTLAPARVIILLDAINNSSRDLRQYRKAVEKFLEQGPGHLSNSISIAVLTDSGITFGQSSIDRDALLKDLTSRTHSLHTFACANEVNPNEALRDAWMHGVVTSDTSAQQLSCLNERFKLSIFALENIAHEQMNIPGRAIVIWIGSGWPLLYEKQFRPDDETVRHEFFNHLVSVSRALGEAQVTLDMVSPSNLLQKTAELDDHDRAFLNGVPSEADVTSGSLSLQALAHQSGGQVLIRIKSAAAGIAECTADASSYYVLSFDSAPAASPDAFHALAITVDKPGVTVRTNTTLYAEQ